LSRDELGANQLTTEVTVGPASVRAGDDNLIANVEFEINLGAAGSRQWRDKARGRRLRPTKTRGAAGDLRQLWR
jgi:hypothetical protein